MSLRIAVTAGYSKSLHAVALTELAAREFEVVLCLEVSLWSRTRLRAYLRQLGPRQLLKKTLNRILLGGKASRETGRVLEFMNSNSISERSLSGICQARGIAHQRVPTLNSPESVELLKMHQVDLVLYAGGGILRKPFLEAPPLGVLNPHAGPLPQFRGMNATEWALMHNVIPHTCVILVNEGIDTGPILVTHPFYDKSLKSLDDFRGAATVAGIQALLHGARARAGGVEPEPQAEGGRQFFSMAPELKQILEIRLAAGLSRLQAADRFAFPSDDTVL